MIEAFERGADADADVLRGAWRILKADLDQDSGFATAPAPRRLGGETPREEAA